MANKCDCEAPYGGEPHDLTECCGGHFVYLGCESCGMLHEFAICEVCGQDLTPKEEKTDCPRPDGFEQDGSCPKHEGSFDCNSFCPICEGEQGYVKEKTR